jgi:hypothetical protein
VRFSSKKNKTSHPNRLSRIFNTMIHIHELREIHISGGQFTWSNNQVTPTLEKLDRILMSRGWGSLFPTVQVYKIPRECSDHNPLILITKQLATIKQRPFRFKLTWLKDDDCLHRVQKIWNESTRDKVALDRVQFKLKKVKRFLKSWGYNKSGQTRKKKMEINEEQRERWRLMRSS